MKLKLHEKFQKLSEDVSGLFVKREVETDLAVATLVAHEHCVFFGDPGIAKSAIISQLMKRVGKEAQYYWIQMFGETPPTDVFGQPSIKALRELDINRRNIKGHLPAAHVAFLDEVFQAPSPVLVGCNSIMMERMFMNGAEKVKTPLISMFGASNFHPEDPQLVAFYDRFTARRIVKPLDDTNDIKAMLKMSQAPMEENPAEVVSLTDIWEAHAAASAIKMPAPVIAAYVKLLTTLRGLDTPITVTDRTKCKAIKYLQAKAFLRGGKEVTITDFPILEHILWTTPNEVAPLAAALKQFKPVPTKQITKISKQLLSYVISARELQADGTSSDIAGQAGMIIAKVQDGLKELGKIKDSAASTPEGRTAFTETVQQLKDWQKEMTAMMAIDTSDLDLD